MDVPKFYNSQSNSIANRPISRQQDSIAEIIPKTKTVNKASFKDAPAVSDKIAEPSKISDYGNTLNSIIMGAVGGQVDSRESGSGKK